MVHQKRSQVATWANDTLAEEPKKGKAAAAAAADYLNFDSDESEELSEDGAEPSEDEEEIKGTFCLSWSMRGSDRMGLSGTSRVGSHLSVCWGRWLCPQIWGDVANAVSAVRGWRLCFPCVLRAVLGRRSRANICSFPACSPFHSQDFQGCMWFLWV